MGKGDSSSFGFRWRYIGGVLNDNPREDSVAPRRRSAQNCYGETGPFSRWQHGCLPSLVNIKQEWIYHKIHL